MKLKKEKRLSPVGTPFTYFVVLDCPPDSYICYSCKKEFKKNDLIMLQKRATFPDENVESMKLKYTKKLYCNKCSQANNICGVWAVVVGINKKDLESSAPKKELPDPPSDKHGKIQS